MAAFVLYAPNINIGGGLVLLRALLLAWPGATPLTVFLDERARERISLPPNAKVFWVKANVASRIKSELDLRKVVGSETGTVLCFHGLPPLLTRPTRTLVFLQNRLLIEDMSLAHFKLKTRVRLIAERMISRAFRHRVSEYIVQTPTMQRMVLHWLGAAGTTRSFPLVRILPFMDAIPAAADYTAKSEWDFAYVADGEAHKNHRNLLAAWCLLAEEGLRPSLALTLSARDSALKQELEAAKLKYDLQVTDLGQLPRESVLALYSKTKALIFPSTAESFGLPLIEASRMGLPIIAPELDYVRDVCVPEQTFDPHSPISIARAAKRFLGHPEPQFELRSPAEFWRALFEEKTSS